MRSSRLVLFLVLLAPLCLITVASATDTGRWTAASSMGAPRDDHAGVALPDGRVMVVGGSLAPTNAEIYNPATDTWSSAGSPSTLRYYGMTATVLPNGKVLVAGGGDGQWTFAAADIYDPATNSWNSAGAMSTPRERHTATLLQTGKVLVSGGLFLSRELSSAELYDPVTNSWTPAGPMMTPRGFHTATLLPDGRVLAAGNTYNPSSELYDPASDTWSQLAPMATSRDWHSATALGDGKVLVLGGWDYDYNILSTAELYDPSTNGWSVVAPLPIQRLWHIATLMPDGKVLVAGGMYRTDEYLADASLYDPATDTWSSTAQMSVSRGRPIAALLKDGRVLVAGGANRDGFLASAEIYRSGGENYLFDGFFQPVDNPEAINTVKAGQTVSVKWKIADSTGQPVSDPASFVSVTSYLADCNDFTGDAAAAVVEGASGNSGLQYLGSGSWQYNWHTPRSYAKQCRVMQLKLQDGSVHLARFAFVK